MRGLIVDAIEATCGYLDRVPSYEQGRWYRAGGWGCRYGLSRLSFELDERWQTGRWR